MISASRHPRAAAAAIAALGVVALLAGCASAPIAKYAAAGDAGQVRALLQQGESPEGADRKNRRALELAVIKRRTAVVRALIEGGANLNHIGPYGKAPLHHAARFGSVDIARLLVEAGADPNPRSRTGATPLIDAATYKQDAIAELLIAAGADVNAVELRRGRSTALHLAVHHNRLALARRLLDAGANPEIPDGRGRTARALAYQLQRSQILAAMDAGKAPQYAQQAPPRPRATPPPSPLANTSAASAASSALLPPVPPGDIAFGRYHALVIGNNQYREFPGLRTAVSDAEAVSELLRSGYDYQVTTLRNATRADILRALGGYRKTLTKSDNLLVYYAGHGWLDEEADQGYWLPVDASPNDEVNWISNASITASVRAMQAKHVLVVADSCYSGKLTRGIHIQRRNPDYLSKLAAKRARVVLTSGGLEPVMDSGGRGLHSVFASAFLDALEHNTGVMEGHEVFTQLKRPVGLNSDQLPEYADMRKAGHDGGDFLFVRRR